MPRTIDQGFRDFLTCLTPSAGESDAAKNHRASIEACLKANFSLQRFFRTGSFGHGTSISGFSDVDYFASIPRERLTQNSSSVIREVKDVLAARFPSTDVRTNCPAVFVPFGTAARDATEVVPADYIEKTAAGHLVYEVADCEGGWMRSSPDAHNAYVDAVNTKHNGKLKPLIRFIKAWKFYRNVPVSSFYLELRIAKYADGEGSIVYDIDVKRVLKHLSECGLASIRDPMGISGYIPACSSETKRADAQSKLDTALSRAEKAVACRESDVKQAFEWWGLVFDGRFPGYYL